MTRTRTLGHDADEWSCTGCGRRLLIRRPPAFEKIVLEPGDEWATHVGGTGGLLVGGVEEGGLAAADRGWLAEHGIDWES